MAFGVHGYLPGRLFCHVSFPERGLLLAVGGPSYYLCLAAATNSLKLIDICWGHMDLKRRLKRYGEEVQSRLWLHGPD